MHNFLQFFPLINNFLFLSPTDEIEVKNVMSLNPLKANGPNDFSTKILKLTLFTPMLYFYTL